MPAKKKSSLTPVQLFYLEGHADTLTAEAIADELNVSLRLVNAAIKRWRKGKEAVAAATAPATTVTPPEPQKPERPHLHFHTKTESGDARRGVVAMTETQSFKDDQRPGWQGSHKSYLERNSKDLAVIEPGQPTC